MCSVSLRVKFPLNVNYFIVAYIYIYIYKRIDRNRVEFKDFSFIVEIAFGIQKPHVFE